MSKLLTTALTAAAVVAALAACGSSTPHAGPPSATALAHRIPGCGALTDNTPPVIVRQDVTCTMPDQSQVEIATFSTTADETKWITDGGDPAYPNPDYLGCCIQGSGWAVTIADGGSGTLIDFYKVRKALGGRDVSG